MNRYEANVSPCSTHVTMSKKSVSPSSERTFTFVWTPSHGRASVRRPARNLSTTALYGHRMYPGRSAKSDKR